MALATGPNDEEEEKRSNSIGSGKYCTQGFASSAFYPIQSIMYMQLLLLNIFTDYVYGV